MSVGIRHQFVVDATRSLLPKYNNRTIPISIFYPGENMDHRAPAHFVDLLEPAPEQALSILVESANLTEEVKQELLQQARQLSLRSFRDIPVNRGGGPYPVLIYSPGGGCHRFSNVPLMEELAGLGYIVVAMDHPFETPVTVLPDGTVCSEPPANDDFIELTLERIRDTKVVLDYLEELAKTDAYGGALDLDRIGMFGHSRGGYVSILAQAEDPRIKAVGNLDGFLYAYWTKDGSTGIQLWPKETQAKLRASCAPVLRICGDGDGIDEQLVNESEDFRGDFFLIRLRDWTHRDFSTSPMLSKVQDANALEKFLKQPADTYRDTLTLLIGEFFEHYFRNAPLELLKNGLIEEIGATVRCKMHN